MIGKYERNENTPSVEVLVKLAQAFNVSLDYIIGLGSISNYNKDVLKRIEGIEQLDDATRKHLYFLIDNIIQNFKNKQVLGYGLYCITYMVLALSQSLFSGLLA